MKDWNNRKYNLKTKIYRYFQKITLFRGINNEETTNFSRVFV